MTCPRPSEDRSLTHPEQAAAQAVQAVAPRQLDPLTIPLAPSEGYVDFFRDHYPELVKAARYAGATREEAEDATSKTLDEMYWKWPIPGSPLRYARKAVINNFIKAKTRGNLRVARRLIERGHQFVSQDGLSPLAHEVQPGHRVFEFVKRAHGDSSLPQGWMPIVRALQPRLSSSAEIRRRRLRTSSSQRHSRASCCP